MTQNLRLHALLMMTLALACSGESSEGLDSQELTRVDEAGAGGDCENGGVQISSGLDENKDGKLDDDEVTDQRVVCAGDTLADPENPELLRRVDALSVGSSECPAGGVAIHSGLDDDRNRTLSDAEIDDTQTVCNDPNHAILTRSASVPIGSPECLYGGKRIEIGTDDGSGEAVANDAVLADGEVETSYLDCNATQPDGLEPLTPPAEPAGSASIDLRGGAGNNAQAGAGGSVLVTPRTASGCVPAITKLFTTGVANAAFTPPALTIDLGSVPFVVTGAVTLEYLEGNNNPVAGRVYYSSSNQLVQWNNADSTPVVTGLRIAAGARLTLPSNSATLSFERDVEIAGTLDLVSGEARGLNLSARQLLVTSDGLIDIPQDNSPAGSISLYANTQLQFLGTLNAQGTAPGLTGAFVNMESAGRVVLGGSIHVSGADAASGVGAAGGSFRASSYAGGVWSSANIDADGGDGAFGGGRGGDIQLGYDDSPRPLDLRNTGNLSVRGGALAPAGCTGGCVAGAGGSITLNATLANLTSSGALNADGGAGLLAAGRGGSLSAAILNFGSDTRPDARMSISGDLFARGGAGTAAGALGGAGGDLTFQNCTGDESVAEFLGYAALHAQGGAASMGGAGGVGGAVELTSFDSVATPRRFYSNVPMDLSGGDGAAAGVGGRLSINLSFEAEVTRELAEGLPSLVLAGAHDIGGGTARSGVGGDAGSVFLATRGDLISSGSLTTSAGDSSPTQYSPYGGTIQLLSSLGSVLNSAALSANGANVPVSQSLPGGNGGCVILEGRKVTNEAALVARGGNGPAGGLGGNITLISHDAPGIHTGSFDVTGGAGTPAGPAGLAGFDLPVCRD